MIFTYFKETLSTILSADTNLSHVSRLFIEDNETTYIVNDILPNIRTSSDLRISNYEILIQVHQIA